MPQRTEDLSDKQKECLRLVHEGLTSKEIAVRLDLTPGTIDNYVNASLARLGLTSRREAARWLVTQEKAVVQQLYLQSEPVALSGFGDEQPGQADDRQDQLVRLPGLPPVGGPDNELAMPQRILAISRIGFAAALLLIATVVIVEGVILLLT